MEHNFQEKNIELEIPANIMYFITTKFHEILLSGFGGVALTNCFSSILHLALKRMQRLRPFKHNLLTNLKA